MKSLLNQPIPAELWHYTTIEGFEGMVSSGTIWASEVHSSRDQTEFVHAREVAESYLAKISPANEHIAKGITAAQNIVRSIFETGWLSQDKTEVFIASFSSAPDRKSQWVDYSKGGQGVAVVMNLTNIRPPTKYLSLVTLAPCVYRAIEKEMLIKQGLNHIISTVTESSRRFHSLAWADQMVRIWRVIDQIYQEPFNRQALQQKLGADFRAEVSNAKSLLSVDLFRLASHCKHHGYFEEQEWRLALPHTKSQPFVYSKIEYRGQTRIPYVAHRISGQPKLPILRVVAGFACKEIVRVRAALAKNGYVVPVTISELPEIR